MDFIASKHRQIYIYDYNFKIPHYGLEKGDDGFNKIPSEVFTDSNLQASDLDTTTISIDQNGTIPLSVFLHKKSLENIVPHWFEKVSRTKYLISLIKQFFIYYSQIFERGFFENILKIENANDRWFILKVITY